MNLIIKSSFSYIRLALFCGHFLTAWPAVVPRKPKARVIMFLDYSFMENAGAVKVQIIQARSLQELTDS